MDAAATRPAATTLTVVGSGTLLPDPERGSACFHVGSRGHALLLDAGPGALHGLARAGLDWRAIDTIAISHFHNDHVSDLPALLHAYRFDGDDRPLTLAGPPGLSGFMERLSALHGEWVLEPSRPLAIVELGDGERWSPIGGDVGRLASGEIGQGADGNAGPEGEAALPARGEIGLEAVPTPHTDRSMAFRVRTPDGVVGYTGDTGPSDRLAVFMERCDVLVAECAVSDPPRTETHLSPTSVAALASAVRPGLLLVTHVYPPPRPERVAVEIAALYGGRVEAAYDGQTVVLSDAGVRVQGGLRGR